MGSRRTVREVMLLKPGDYLVDVRAAWEMKLIVHVVIARFRDITPSW